LREIASVERKIEDFPFGDNGAKAGYGGLDDLRVGVDLNFFAFCANLKRHGDNGRFVDVERDTLLNVALEAGALDLELVVADGQFEEQIGAGMVGGGDAA